MPFLPWSALTGYRIPILPSLVQSSLTVLSVAFVSLQDDFEVFCGVFCVTIVTGILLLLCLLPWDFGYARKFPVLSLSTCLGDFLADTCFTVLHLGM